VADARTGARSSRGWHETAGADARDRRRAADRIIVPSQFGSLEIRRRKFVTLALADPRRCDPTANVRLGHVLRGRGQVTPREGRQARLEAAGASRAVAPAKFIEMERDAQKAVEAAPSKGGLRGQGLSGSRRGDQWWRPTISRTRTSGNKRSSTSLSTGHRRAPSGSRLISSMASAGDVESCQSGLYRRESNAQSALATPHCAATFGEQFGPVD